LTKYRQALCLPVLVFLCADVFAQNLVTNSDFEYYTTCPDAVGELPNATPWLGAGTSADYYNACANSTIPYLGLPIAGFGYQYAHSGNGFAGIMCYYGNGTSKREYLHAQLSQTMNPNRVYLVSLYVNLFNNSKYAVKNIAVSFTNTTFDSPNEDVVNLNSNVYLFGKPMIKDTLNWIKITGLYVGQGTEQFITVGNFFDDAGTELENINLTGENFSYYYIDDVLVEEIFQPFWQYHDTTIYYGDSVLIGPALTGLEIDWYTDNLDFISNAPGIYVTPPTSRDYIAKETFNGVETEHVVHVTVIGGAGLEENELQNVRVFPNPSKGSFSISGLMSDKPLQLEVRDVHGKLVFSQTSFEVLNGSFTFTLDVDNGIYFVNVINPITKESTVEKLVIYK
jgi:hypothetical protein